MSVESVAATVAEPPRVLRMRGLRKQYANVPALQGLDLDVHEGQVYGFLGRNGAGKSTGLRIVMGITAANAGHVEIFGRALNRGDIDAKRSIGYVAQEQSFYEWMTAESIGRFVSGFYPTWDDAEYLRLLNLLEVPRARKLQTFSGGMHAKLALTLALAHRPKLLLLDEPTAGMDAVARREFMEIVRDQAERAHRTTVFSSHLIDEVEIAADTVGIVHEGRMLYQGPVDALRASVRSVTHALDGPVRPWFPPVDDGLAPGLQVLQDRERAGKRQLILRAKDPAVFTTMRVAGWQVEPLRLEETFVAMVTRPVAL